MLYLIGLGLNEKGISLEGIEILKKCNKIYLENYTVNFPYSLEDLENILNVKITPLERKDVESLKLLKQAKTKTIALLIYGNPLFATTHIHYLNDAKELNVKLKVIHNSSILDGISESGLQLYKFGKITSMPFWRNNYEPISFLDVIENNLKINAHSLILIDIGLSFKKAIIQLEMALERKALEIDKIIVCSQIGKDSKFFYGDLEELKEKDFKMPFCFIVPGELHFLEKEFLKGL